MNILTRCYLRLRAHQRGQTMAEYGLIMTAVAVAAFAVYTTLGTGITALVNKVAVLL